MKSHLHNGYTLIELVVGIITFSIVLTIVTDLLAPQANRSIDPIYQVRATELAQSLFNEMSGKLFDENADRSGGRIRCNEDLDGDGLATNTAIGERVCTVPILLGPEDGLGGRPNGNENDREVYDDVDDYHGLQFTDGSQFQNSLGEQLVIDGSNLYEGFQMDVEVAYDADQDGGADTSSGNIKRIDVVVTTPNGEEIYFSVFKHNY
ncbi:MAG: prepilin-type N-terminal cleavage/methylation domain-containing protein [Aestuariibacter sp.]